MMRMGEERRGQPDTFAPFAHSRVRNPFAPFARSPFAGSCQVTRSLWATVDGR